MGMIRFVFNEFEMARMQVEFMQHLFGKEALKSDCKSRVTDDQKRKACNYLRAIKAACSKLEMHHSLSVVEQIQNELMQNDWFPFHHTLETQCTSLWNMMQRDVAHLKFAFIHPDNVKYFEKPLLFGGEVEAAFPSAASEIMDAGNCLAADLHTAAVFHLMRTTEHGLRSLAKHLKVRLKHPVEFLEWGEIISAIESKLSTVRQMSRGKKKMAELEFFGVILSECNTLKDVWRNPAMHARTRFDEDEALGVFDRVKSLMQKLSERLSEVN
jgi:hypothetical protein